MSQLFAYFVGGPADLTKRAVDNAPDVLYIPENRQTVEHRPYIQKYPLSLPDVIDHRYHRLLMIQNTIIYFHESLV